MDEKALQEIFHEFISSLEALDTRSSAISQFLKDKGIATEEALAPYLERAGNASGVRWLGTRVRIDYLFSTASKPEENTKPQEGAKSEEPTARETANHSEKPSAKDGAEDEDGASASKHVATTKAESDSSQPR